MISNKEKFCKLMLVLNMFNAHLRTFFFFSLGITVSWYSSCGFFLLFFFLMFDVLTYHCLMVIGLSDRNQSVYVPPGNI